MESHEKAGLESTSNGTEVREQKGETSCPSGRPVDHYQPSNHKYSKQELISLLTYAEAKRWSTNHKRQWTTASLPEATERCIRQWFELVDDDGSGQLDASELKFALKASGIPANPTSVMEMIRMFDLDHDGEIAWSEFYNFLTTEADKDPLGSDYVLPSGMVLSLGNMIDTIRRRKMLNDVEKGGASRSFWVAEGPELLRCLIESENYSFDNESRDLLLRILSYKPAPSKQADPEALEEHKRQVQRLKSTILLRTNSMAQRDSASGASSSNLGRERSLRFKASPERFSTRSSMTNSSHRSSIEESFRQGPSAKASRDGKVASADPELPRQGSLHTSVSFAAKVLATSEGTEETDSPGQDSPGGVRSRCTSAASHYSDGVFSRRTSFTAAAGGIGSTGGNRDGTGDSQGETSDIEGGRPGSIHPDPQQGRVASGETVKQAVAAVQKVVECAEAMRRMDETLEHHHQRTGTARRRFGTGIVALGSSRAGGPRVPVVLPVQDMAAELPRPPSVSPLAAAVSPTAQSSARSMYSTAVCNAPVGSPSDGEGGAAWVASASAMERSPPWAPSGSADGACGGKGAAWVRGHQPLCEGQGGNAHAESDGGSAEWVTASGRRQMLSTPRLTSNSGTGGSDIAAWMAASGRCLTMGSVRDDEVSVDGSGGEMGGSRKCYWASSALGRRTASWQSPRTTLDQSSCKNLLMKSSPLILATSASLQHSEGVPEAVDASTTAAQSSTIYSTSTAALDELTTRDTSPPEVCSPPRTAPEHAATHDTIVITRENEGIQNAVVDNGGSSAGNTADGTNSADGTKTTDGTKAVTTITMPSDSFADALVSSPRAPSPRLHVPFVERPPSTSRGPYSPRLIQSGRTSKCKAHGGPEASPPRATTPPLLGEGPSANGADSPFSISANPSESSPTAAADSAVSRISGVLQGEAPQSRPDPHLVVPRPDFLSQVLPAAAPPYAPQRAYLRVFSGRAEAASAAAAIRRQAWSSTHQSLQQQQHQVAHRLGSSQPASIGVLPACMLQRPFSPSHQRDQPAMSPGIWYASSTAGLSRVPSPTCANPVMTTTGPRRSADFASLGDECALIGQNASLLEQSISVTERQVDGLLAELPSPQQQSGILSPRFLTPAFIARGGGSGGSVTSNVGVRLTATGNRRSFDLEPRTGIQRTTSRGSLTGALYSMAAGKSKSFVHMRGGASPMRTYLPTSICAASSRMGIMPVAPSVAAANATGIKASGATMPAVTEATCTTILAERTATGDTADGGGAGVCLLSYGDFDSPPRLARATEPLPSSGQAASPDALGLGAPGDAQVVHPHPASVYRSAAGTRLGNSEARMAMASVPTEASNGGGGAGQAAAGQAAAARRRWPWPWGEDLVRVSGGLSVQPSGSGAAPARTDSAPGVQKRLPSVMRRA